jgi:indolepyruvate ferredoxin oxidoreductase alpha subunit
MERSFKEEVAKLKLGEGETFHGEGILAVTKALLQSGVSYVGGYQGAPVSHVMDVLNDARDILDGLGVHVESNANEAGAAAMLGASMRFRTSPPPGSWAARSWCSAKTTAKAPRSSRSAAMPSP